MTSASSRPPCETASSPKSMVTHSTHDGATVVRERAEFVPRFDMADGLDLSRLGRVAGASRITGGAGSRATTCVPRPVDRGLPGSAGGSPSAR